MIDALEADRELAHGLGRFVMRVHPLISALGSMCLALAAASCGGTTGDDASGSQSAPLQPAESVLSISISPGTFDAATSTWYVPADSQRTITMHVADVNGAPATSGWITVQFCATRDGSPLAATECEPGGSGRWQTVGRIEPNSSGDASFTQSASTETFGMRFKYSGRGSGFANATSDPITIDAVN
jgi:hypothetical protein